MSDESTQALIVKDNSGISHQGKKGFVNVDIVSANFENGDLVNVETLKKKKLIPSNVERVKLLARGTLNKQLNFELQDYSLQAVKMVALVGGTIKKVN